MNGTQFQLVYHVPYSGSYKFSPKLMQSADNVAVLLPKSMRFEPGAGATYQPVADDPNAQTLLVKEAKPGAPLDFTVSGTGAMPRDSQAGAGGPGSGAQTADEGATQSGPGGKPGGGLGNPIDTEDPLSKYIWWILGGLFLAFVVAAAFFLRKPPVPAAGVPAGLPVSAAAYPVGLPVGRTKSQLLLEALKEELFAIESEKIVGTLSAHDYAEVKSALEIVLKRALGRQ